MTLVTAFLRDTRADVVITGTMMTTVLIVAFAALVVLGQDVVAGWVAELQAAKGD